MGYQQNYPGADIFTVATPAWIGASAPAGATKIRKEFTYAGNTDGSGLLTVPYLGGAFPNGIVSVFISPGDTANSLGFFQVPLAGQSLTNLVAYAWKAASFAVVVSGTVRANVIAVGW